MLIITSQSEYLIPTLGIKLCMLMINTFLVRKRNVILNSFYSLSSFEHKGFENVFGTGEKIMILYF